MLEVIVNNYPKSSLAEDLKAIKTNLKFSSINKKNQVILLTSSVSGEGKSFIAANLAALYANSKEKVLLIDCDLRMGRQHRIFGLDSDMGVSNLLVSEDGLDNINDYIQKSKIKNLDVLPAGTIPPNPTVLLESVKMENLLVTLREKYDVIILDSVPVIGFTDSLLLSKLVDTTLIVAKAKKTTKDMLENTKNSLDMVGANIAGVILNNAKRNKNKYYGRYYR